MARDGWTLALHSHHETQPESDLAATLKEWHGFVADLADPAQVEALIPQIEAFFGQTPRLLVNCASLFEDDDAGTADAASLVRFHAINALAPQTLALVLARRGGEGAVVNILDQRVRNPVPDQLSYSLSKSALAASTRTLAVALAPRWRVNAVAPGLTLPSPAHDDNVMAQTRRLMPLRRLPTPDDIADAVLYFARAAAVSGQTLFVDGGASLTGIPPRFRQALRGAAVQLPANEGVIRHCCRTLSRVEFACRRRRQFLGQATREAIPSQCVLGRGRAVDRHVAKRCRPARRDPGAPQDRQRSPFAYGHLEENLRFAFPRNIPW